MKVISKNIMPDLCSRRTPHHYLTAIVMLMKIGVSPGNIELLAKGEYENYRGEVLSQRPKPGTPLKKDSRVSLEIGCSSAVDYMPYQFFYGLEGIRSSDRSWVENARRFMAPFESAYVKSEAGALMNQLKYDFGIIDLEYLRKFMGLFEFEGEEFIEDMNELLFWVSVFPPFHFWAGNPGYVEKVLSYIFGYEFRIIENVRSEYDIPESIQYRLGSKTGRLARETIIGKKFSEQDSCYRVEIIGVTPDRTAGFLPGKPIRKKIEWILGFCMPGNLEYDIKVRVKHEKAYVGGEAGNCYLGYSSFVYNKR